METDQEFPRGDFNRIVRGCLAILEARGFKFPDSVDASVVRIFERLFETTFDKVAAPRARYTGLDAKGVDNLTLDWALVMSKNGVTGVHYGTTLEAIRTVLLDLLTLMRYDVAGFRGVDKNRGWARYRRWAELAMKDGLDRHFIDEYRQARKAEGGYYEE